MAGRPQPVSSRVTPFRIDVPDAVLADLAVRLDRTRLADEVDDGDWNRGMHRGYLASLLRYWRHQFDWRAQEAALNRLPHGRVELDGLGVHVIQVRGRGPNPLPLILTHGYPDSFIRFLNLIPRLTDPAAHGGDAADAFDVVVPSLPGYGFSDRPKKSGTTFRIGELWHTLMTDVLGYRRYGAHGGDWGSTVTEQLARSHAGAVVGIHLTDVPFWHQFQKPSDPSAAEQAYFADTEAWIKEDGAYALIQGTRPQTLAPALNDSPAGLAAWIVEKFQRVERLRRRRRAPLQQGLAADQRDDLLGRRQHRLGVPAVLRLHVRGRAALDRRGRQAMGRIVGRAGGVRDVPQGHLPSAAGVGRALLQRPALDRDAARRTLRRPRGARPPRRRPADVLPPAALRRGHDLSEVTRWLPSARRS